MSDTPWQSNVALSPTIVRTLIETQFSILCPITSIKYVDQGFDNTVYLINDQIIFRFPRRADAATLLLREQNILSHLQGRFELQIPHPLYIGKPSDRFPYPFHGYQMLAGTAGCYSNLSPAQRAQSIVLLAQFLRALHTIPQKTVESWGATTPIYDRTDWARASTSLRKRISILQHGNTLTVDSAAIEHEIEKAGLLKLSKQRTLVHNDLYAKHILFVDGALSGIIDWGDSCMSHPTVDLAIIHGFYPAAYHQDFLQAYGPVAHATWEYARFLAIYYACTLAWYAIEQGDTALLKDSIGSLQRLGIATTLEQPLPY